MGQEPRGHDQSETAVINTPKGSSASGIERANYEAQKQIRTLRSRFEENYGESVGLDHKMLPFLVRHSAWLITHCQVKSDGKTHKRDFVDDRTKDRWQSLLKLYTSGTAGKLQTCPSWTTDGTLGLWLGKSLASDEHYVGTSAGVRRCRSIWSRPEKQRGTGRC